VMSVAQARQGGKETLADTIALKQHGRWSRDNPVLPPATWGSCGTPGLSSASHAGTSSITPSRSPRRHVGSMVVNLPSIPRAQRADWQVFVFRQREHYPPRRACYGQQRTTSWLSAC
jgi:hypothetical protein